MFKKLLESLDAIAHTAPVKKANESKYPWLDHKDRPGNKKAEDDKASEERADPKKKDKEAVEEAVTLSADGDEAMELINGMRKLAGMSPVAGALSPVPTQAPAAPVAAAPAPEAPPVAVAPEPAPPVSNAEQTTAAFASLPADSWDDADDEDETDNDEQMVVGSEADDEDDEDDEDEVKEADNASIYSNSPDESTQDASAVTGSGDDMHKKKGGYPATAGGDNPMKAFEGKFKAIMADLLKD